MVSAEVVMPAMGLLGAIYGGPPLLLMLSGLRRGLRARAYGRNPAKAFACSAGGGLALIFNLVVVLPTLAGLPGGALHFSALSIAGLAVAWISFWVWVALGTVLRRPRSAAF
ncbi:MAG: hypothetical protein ACKVPY_16295 [Paracoccaceae bacterium]